MTDPLLVPNGRLAFQARHVRSLTGLVGMGLAVGAAVAIQVARHAHDVALLAKGCTVGTETPLPTTWLQLTYSLVIPVGMPVLLFVFSLMLFSPMVFGQVVASIRTLLPWAKAA